jgi:hypothetical protein
MKLFFFYFLIIYLAPDQLISREDTTHYTTHTQFSTLLILNYFTCYFLYPFPFLIQINLFLHSPNYLSIHFLQIKLNF